MIYRKKRKGKFPHCPSFIWVRLIIQKGRNSVGLFRNGRKMIICKRVEIVVTYLNAMLKSSTVRPEHMLLVKPKLIKYAVRITWWSVVKEGIFLR
jgi:hypothetical protein